MKKIFAIAMALACGMALQAKTLYLNTGGTALWETDNANHFAVWHWQGSGQGQWTGWMSRVNGNVWSVNVSDASNMVIFCRFSNSATSPDWGTNMWNQTEDLEPGSNNLFTITGWGNGKSQGTWSVYSGDNPGGEGGDPVVPSDFASAVPSQCEDIILQTFYWKSNINSGYGDTKWATLSGQVDEISKSFTMVWLPPSAQASGISQGGLGYIPLEYSSQSCQMGKRAALESLIGDFHNHGLRVIADIVINHIGNPEGNCSLKVQNFGSYGSFTPTKDWLTSDDEGGCGSNGNADDGQHDANYPSARDWDHKNTQVQNMCKAYLKWMKGEMKYDGFRYDYVGGFHVSHINDYNAASKPYFSVIEYWMGDANELKTRIDQAGKNTLAFDFATKYTAFRDGIYQKNYTNCLNAGLRGKGYSRYAVNFIDNHDTFNRGNESEDVANKRDGSSINDQSLMMRCHAYLLSMPGVPCVFYPHWVQYKSEIQKMIVARRMAGIHSESTVEESASTGYYKATVHGKYGNVIVYLGSAAGEAAPTGYQQAVKGSDYAMYYTGNGAQGVEEVRGSNVQTTKYLQDGRLYIRCGEKMYDAQGRLVK
ncbi:MAG: hypothetical protein II551_04290 [Paludibacteraceae bacterium]|nr:hypothetical protein [Paludibacteraceae bacterium]